MSATLLFKNLNTSSYLQQIQISYHSPEGHSWSSPWPLPSLLWWPSPMSLLRFLHSLPFMTFLCCSCTHCAVTFLYTLPVWSLHLEYQAQPQHPTPQPSWCSFAWKLCSSTSSPFRGFPSCSLFNDVPPFTLLPPLSSVPHQGCIYEGLHFSCIPIAFHV